MEELESYLRDKGVDVRRGAGQEIVTHCFWCPDGDPKGRGKLYLNSESWLYQCKRCDMRGNRKTLLEHFGDADEVTYIPGEDPAARRALLEEYTTLTEELLTRNEGMLLYLLRRGLSAETIERARLGYAPANTGVIASLPGKHPRAVAIKTGLLSEDGREFLQKRITIPYISSGAIVQVRGKDPEGKYVTPPGNNARLYNIDALRDADKVIITEGEMDCLILQQFLGDSPEAGVRSIGVVGIPGANALPDHFEDLFSQTKRVYIGLDSDETGRAAAVKLKTMLGTKSRIIELPREWKDWTDYLKDGEHDWRDVMRLIHEADMSGKRIYSMQEAGARWEKNQVAVPGIKTGFATFDTIIKPGLRPGNLMIALAKTGTGKGHPLSTDVATPSGWRKWGDLAPGDYVFGSDGEPTRVVAVWDRGVLPTYKVDFSDRTSVTVDADHLWEVQYRAGRFREWRSKTLNTAELMASDLRVGEEYRYRIPMAEPVQYPARDYDVDPYTLGALIANGSLKFTTAALTTPDREVIERISRAHVITETKSEACPRFTVHKVIGDLRRMGLAVGSAEKFIPVEYLLGSVDQRLALLQGLMDGDGSSRGADGRRAVQYFTSSPRLAADIRELVASLGGTAMERWHQREGARPEGVLSIMLPDGMQPFSTSRKVRGETKYKTGPRRCITNIEPVGSEDIRCITVDAPDSLYLIGRSYTVTHNTLFLSNLAYNMRSRRVLFITLEMMADEIYAILRKISRFHNPRLDDREIQAQMPYLRIVDENRLTADDFALLIEEYTEDVGEPPEIVYVDYLGYYAKGQKGGSPYEKTSNAVMQLKEEAKRHEVAIIAPHQVNRGARDGKPLDADEARDSGVVEETGDFVVGLFRPGEAVDDNTLAPGKVSGALGMSILKSRRGGKGKVVQLHMSMASLAIVDDTDRKAVARIDQENAALNRGETYDDLYREQCRAADAQSQLRLIKDSA